MGGTVSSASPRLVFLSPPKGGSGIDEEHVARWPLLLGVALERAGAFRPRILRPGPGGGGPPAPAGGLVAESRLTRGFHGQFLVEVRLHETADFRLVAEAGAEAQHAHALPGVAREIGRTLWAGVTGQEPRPEEPRLRKVAIFRFTGPREEGELDAGTLLASELEYALDEALFVRGVTVEAHPERVGQAERDPRFTCAEYGADGVVYGSFERREGKLAVELLVGHCSGWVVGLKRADRWFTLPGSGPPAEALLPCVIAAAEDLGVTLTDSEKRRAVRPWAEDPAVWADLHRARQAQHRGELVRALDLLRKACDAAVAVHDHRGTATASLILAGWEAPRLGDEAQRGLARQALAEYGKAGDARGRAAALYLLARLQRALGDNAEAEACLRESMAVSRRLRDSLRAGLVMVELAELMASKGRREQGRVQAQLNRALERFRASGARVEEGWTLLRLGWRLRDEPARAVGHLEEAFRLAVETGDTQLEQEVAGQLSELAYPPDLVGFVREWLEESARKPPGSQTPTGLVPA
jgi:tetratricopeptide (TPR) repeat protein